MTGKDIQARAVSAGESPATVHGRLLEAVHITGYSFERVCAELDWLLEEDRWKLAGPGFDDINKFLASVDLSAFRPSVEQRKKLVAKLSAIEASQRATARMLGVANETVRRDLGIAVTSVTPATEKPSDDAAVADPVVTSVTPPVTVTAPAPAITTSGSEVAAQAQAKATAEATREEKRQQIIERLDAVTTVEAKPAQGLYDVVVIDPPWPMQKIERDVRPNQSEFDYPTMSEDELADLSVPVADDCHVWLWTTHKFLPMAFRLLERWGLKYVCTFVWHKSGGFQPIGLPQYNCEFALYARRGAPQFIDTKAFPTAFSAPRGAHSEKPEEFYNVVRRVTAGRRLDMFNRRAIPGFDTWGKEAA